jgi:SAM-dependent methyltransferase
MLMNGGASEAAQYGRRYAAEQLRRSRHPLRQVLKAFYVNHVLRDVRGPTIDIGCGAGQLLARLPNGSVGLGVNGHLVDPLRAAGLPVTLYDPDQDRFALTGLPVGQFQTVVIIHVLEHLRNADEVLRTLLDTCARLGISRVIAVVPGWRGFQSDETHRTFIDEQYVARHHLARYGGFELTTVRHFPLNVQRFGDYAACQELKLVWDRKT